MRRVYAFFGGRSTTFAWAIFSAGVCLAALGKLTTDFVALAGAIHGFVIARAISEDKYLEGQCGSESNDK